MLKKLSPISRRYQVQQYDHAVEVLKRRMFRGSGYSQEQIQQAVDFLRQHDPEHPLLRYSERWQVLERI